MMGALDGKNGKKRDENDNSQEAECFPEKIHGGHYWERGLGLSSTQKNQGRGHEEAVKYEQSL